MATIIPAVLVKKEEDLKLQLATAAKFAERVQIDICDGVYVGSKSWPLSVMDKAEFIGKAGTEDLYLPEWESLDFTADLMCEYPLELLDVVCQYGFDEVVLHFRSLEDEFQALYKSDSSMTFDSYFESILYKLGSYGVDAALAIDQATDADKFVKFLMVHKDRIKYLQIMGIEKIGYQGEPFSEITLEIVSELSEFGLPICIDGGMYDESILASLASGADMCVVGSAIGLGAPGAKENYKYLSSLE